ncbi:unnamed protein product [Arctia plantaginis]|uniref:Uncharacterized protein n=1 Tax=Arctia plantaginis TaxID=874455 RepID=A0A8S0ZKR8_ARCPL|nr:unnamed protein product [Arctia plantaginis]
MAHSSNKRESRALKKTSSGTLKSQEQIIEQWLENEIEHEFSDFDDEVRTQIFSAKPNVLMLTRSPTKKSSYRDQVLRSLRLLESVKKPRTSNQNIIRVKMDSLGVNKRAPGHRGLHPIIFIIRLPSRLNHFTFEGYFDLWSKVFDQSMLERLVTFTNQKLNSYRAQFKESTKVELMDTNVTETKAFIGLMYVLLVSTEVQRCGSPYNICNRWNWPRNISLCAVQMAFFLFDQLPSL